MRTPRESAIVTQRVCEEIQNIREVAVIFGAYDWFDTREYYNKGLHQVIKSVCNYHDVSYERIIRILELEPKKEEI